MALPNGLSAYYGLLLPFSSLYYPLAIAATYYYPPKVASCCKHELVPLGLVLMATRETPGPEDIG